MTNPKHPVYIISKGRSESMLTSRSLARMKVPHYIAIEPQDEDLYEEALDKFKIRPYVTLLVAPFSNHGDGPGRARNWCWDHSISIGAEKHWVLDDNIDGFCRLNRNERHKVTSGTIFRIAEDFVERYENVSQAGFEYRFFAGGSRRKKPAFRLNTRIYSCILNRNDVPYRWRGRYNEDTDLSLRMLKDGWCTVLFQCFLQNKAATQTVKGGNTAEFYEKEGTLPKSQMLVDLHPDVSRLAFRYGRHHHHVDYSVFQKNQLIKKDGIIIPDGVNNYGMILT